MKIALVNQHQDEAGAIAGHARQLLRFTKIVENLTRFPDRHQGGAKLYANVDCLGRDCIAGRKARKGFQRLAEESGSLTISGTFDPARSRRLDAVIAALEALK